ncbi:MAG: Swt1 family HEPN domain-containing protein [Alphaproteobacteria bacterium]
MIEHTVRLFGLNNLSIEAEIRKIEQDLDVDLGHRGRVSRDIDDTYFPQFAERLRQEAATMATHYAIFYCLENSIRELIVQRLDETHGLDWWDQKVPEVVRKNAEANRTKERTAAVTPRSTELIDYINFGELGEIIKANFDIFGDMFRDIKALEKVLSNLNTLRAPIAHCKALAEDEVLRLHLSLRDWFRQME